MADKIKIEESIDLHKQIEKLESENLLLRTENKDFPDKLIIVEANRLYIPKRDISQRALNRIKRLAAFSNPHFYKTQKMRMSTFGILRIIDIALVQSLIHDNEVDDIVKNYGMVIVDECHHVPSVNYEKVLGAINARYVYGLTATPKRQDGQHPIIFMQCGAIRYSVDAKSQAGKRNFEHYIIPCFTSFKKPFTQAEETWHITQIYTTLAEDETRNSLSSSVKTPFTFAIKSLRASSKSL
jgi:superfamily II DNA or RNA helicase